MTSHHNAIQILIFLIREKTIRTPSGPATCPRPSCCSPRTGSPPAAEGEASPSRRCPLRLGRTGACPACRPPRWARPPRTRRTAAAPPPPPCAPRRRARRRSGSPTRTAEKEKGLLTSPSPSAAMSEQNTEGKIKKKKQKTLVYFDRLPSNLFTLKISSKCQIIAY